MSASNTRTPTGLAANLLIVAGQRRAMREALDRVEVLAADYEQRQATSSETFFGEDVAAEIRAAIRGDGDTVSEPHSTGRDVRY